MKTILCENPQLIVNPDLKEFVLRFGNYTINKVDFSPLPAQLEEWTVFFPYKNFFPKRNSVTVENYEDSYVTDPSTGEIYPMYIQVPCRKCILCREKKAREWSFRCLMESQEHNTYAWFCTFTINDYSLRTYFPFGCEKRPVQLYLKRLRENLASDGYDCNLRYLFVSEYGSRTGRPHYHAILFGLPHIPEIDLYNYINLNWKYGFVNAHPIVPKPTDKGYGAISYVCKYMRKDCDTPWRYSRCQPFFLSSRGHGGLGWLYLSKYIQYIRENPVAPFSVLDKFSGRTFAGAIPESFIRKLFPTKSQFVPESLKVAWKLYQWQLYVSASMRKYLDVDGSYYTQLDCFLHRKYSFLPASHLEADADTYVSSIFASHRSDVVYSEIQQELVTLRKLLFEFDVESIYAEYYLSLSQYRKNLLRKYYSTQDSPDVEFAVNALVKRRKQSLANAVF